MNCIQRFAVKRIELGSKSILKDLRRTCCSAHQESLGQIDSIELELSLVPLYEGQAPLPELYEYLCGLGYQLVALSTVFDNPTTGQLLQVDGAFHRFRLNSSVARCAKQSHYRLATSSR